MVRRLALHSPSLSGEGRTRTPLRRGGRRPARGRQTIRAAELWLALPKQSEGGLFDNFIGEGGARGPSLAAARERLHSAGWPTRMSLQSLESESS